MSDTLAVIVTPSGLAVVEREGRPVMFGTHASRLLGLLASDRERYWTMREAIEVLWPDPDAQPDYAPKIVAGTVINARKYAGRHLIETRNASTRSGYRLGADVLLVQACPLCGQYGPKR